MTDPIEFSSLPQADQDAIVTNLLALSSGFQARDVNQLAGIYSADADWVNAFGTIKKGQRPDPQVPPGPLRRRELQRRQPRSAPRGRHPGPHPRGGTGLRPPSSRRPETRRRRRHPRTGQPLPKGPAPPARRHLAHRLGNVQRRQPGSDLPPLHITAGHKTATPLRPLRAARPAPRRSRPPAGRLGPPGSTSTRPRHGQRDTNEAAPMGGQRSWPPISMICSTSCRTRLSSLRRGVGRGEQRGPSRRRREALSLGV